MIVAPAAGLNPFQSISAKTRIPPVVTSCPKAGGKGGKIAFSIALVARLSNILFQEDSLASPSIKIS